MRTDHCNQAAGPHWRAQAAFSKCQPACQLLSTKSNLCAIKIILASRQSFFHSRSTSGLICSRRRLTALAAKPTWLPALPGRGKQHGRSLAVKQREPTAHGRKRNTPCKRLQPRRCKQRPGWTPLGQVHGHGGTHGNSMAVRRTNSLLPPASY